MARRINLVPATERARTKTNVGMLVMLVAIVIVLGGLGFGYYLLTNSRTDWENELERVKQETVSVKGQIASLQQYEQLARSREDTEDLVQAVYAGRTLVADVLNSVSLVVPENVWFDTLSLTAADPTATIGPGGATNVDSGDNQVSVEGYTYGFEDIAQFLVRLQLLPMLSEVALTNAANESEASAVKAFSVEAVLDKPTDEELPLPLSQVEVEGL